MKLWPSAYQTPTKRGHDWLSSVNHPMAFQNTNRFNLYWLTARTNKELHAWCLENGIKLPKTSRKFVFIKAIEQCIADCGIDIKTHPDYMRATRTGCLTHGS